MAMIYDPVRAVEKVFENRPVHHVTFANSKGRILTSIPAIYLTDMIRHCRELEAELQEIHKAKFGGP